MRGRIREGDRVAITIGESNGRGAYAWRQAEGDGRGTLEDWPAFEINGNPGVARGSVVSARYSSSVGGLLFQEDP